MKIANIYMYAGTFIEVCNSLKIDSLLVKESQKIDQLLTINY